MIDFFLIDCLCEILRSWLFDWVIHSKDPQNLSKDPFFSWLPPVDIKALTPETDIHLLQGPLKVLATSLHIVFSYKMAQIF